MPWSFRRDEVCGGEVSCRLVVEAHAHEGETRGRITPDAFFCTKPPTPNRTRNGTRLDGIRGLAVLLVPNPTSDRPQRNSGVVNVARSLR